jgi:hypothetical protein
MPVGKFSDGEIAEIQATAHAHVQRWRDENRQLAWLDCNGRLAS